MGIVAMLLFGLIAGALAQAILPGKDFGGRGMMGVLITIGVGIAGAFVGGFIGSALGLGGVTGFNLGSLLLAIVGAIVFLAIWRAAAGGMRRAT